MAKAVLPPEACQACGKNISARARANVIDNRIVCSPCWRKLDGDRQIRERGAGPASENQLGYACSLGIDFPPDVTWDEMHDLLVDGAKVLIGFAGGLLTLWLATMKTRAEYNDWKRRRRVTGATSAGRTKLGTEHAETLIKLRERGVTTIAVCEVVW